MAISRVRWERSLHTRLVSAYLALSLVGLAVVATLVFLRARDALNRSVRERLRTVAESRETELNRWIEAQTHQVAFLARVPDVRRLASRAIGGDRAASAELTSLFRMSVEQGQDQRELFLLTDVGARIVISTDSTRIGEYRVTDEYFVRGRRGSFVQNVYPSPLTGLPTLTVSTPVLTGDGKRIGVLAAHLNLQRLDRIVSARLGLGESGEAYVVDRYSEFVSGRRFGSEQYRRGVHSTGIDSALSGRRGSALYANYAGTPVIGVYQWMPQRELALIAELPQREAFTAARQLAVSIVLIGLIAGIVLGMATRALAGQISRPILAIADAARAVADGDLTRTAPVARDDELGLLAQVFNGMTAQLRILYQGLEERVSESRRAADALRESQQLLQAIVDNSTAVISAKSIDGRILLMNRSYEELFEVSRADAMGQFERDILTRDTAAEVTGRDHPVFESGEPVQMEATVRGRHLLTVRFPLRHDDGAVYAICRISTDITERRQAEEERRNFETQLQHAQKLESLGLLAGGIAHDFNNLLVVMLGNAGLALMELGKGAPVREYVEQIETAAHRAAELTNQMLAYSGRGRFHVEALDLSAAAREMSQLLEVSISKKVTLEFAFAPELPPVDADAAQIRQVIMNLITNASDAIGDARGQIALSTGVIKLGAGPLPNAFPAEAPGAGSYAYVRVSDTGSGMDAGTRARIFDPFFTTKFTGRGLGLAAVLGIVRGHYGRIQVESEPGEGSTFTIYLPVAARRPPARTEAVAPIEAWRGRGTILVADDEPGVRTFTTKALQRYGFTVISARDGREAIQLFAQHADEIVAVLLDLTMPNVNGMEALREIRRIRPEARVILSSGYDQHDTAAGLAGGTRTAFVQKPYRPSALIETLRDILAPL